MYIILCIVVVYNIHNMHTFSGVVVVVVVVLLVVCFALLCFAFDFQGVETARGRGVETVCRLIFVSPCYIGSIR